MTPDEALAKVVEHNLILEPRIFGWFAHMCPLGRDSPEGTGPTPIAAIEDFVIRLATQPPENWTYTSRPAILIVSPTADPSNLGLSDLGL